MLVLRVVNMRYPRVLLENAFVHVLRDVEIYHKE
jgi:hypothetical protein